MNNNIDSIQVLVVDDDPGVRLFNVTAVEETGHAAVEAGNGEEAIDLVRNQSPDIVIMDIAMPDFNGIDATKQIHAEMPSVKVVALSMHAGKHFVESMLQAGAVGQG